jgi:hypothetical protein
MAWRNGLVINKLKMLFQCIDRGIKFYISSITFDSRKLAFKIIVIFTIFSFNHHFDSDIAFLVYDYDGLGLFLLVFLFNMTDFLFLWWYSLRNLTFVC